MKVLLTVLLTTFLGFLPLSEVTFAEDPYSANDMMVDIMKGLNKQLGDYTSDQQRWNDCLQEKRDQKYGMLDRDKDVGDCWRQRQQTQNQRQMELIEQSIQRDKERKEIDRETQARASCDHHRDDMAWGLCMKRQMGPGY